MRKTLVLLLSALTCCSVLAGTPPTLPAQLPPLEIPRAPHVPARKPNGRPVPASVEFIKSLGLSSSLERDLINQLTAHPPAASNAAPALNDPSAPKSQSHHFEMITNTTPAGAGQATNDALQDIEPAIITNRFNSVDTTFHVFTKFDANNVPHQYWTSTTNNASFTGSPSGLELPRPAGTTRVNDPWLSENPYVSAGAFPKRTYISGFAYDVANGFPSYNALTVWYNDNGQTNCDPLTGSWCSTVVDQANFPLGFDKPSIATSWHQGTLGYTYVAAIVVHYDNQYHDIQLYRQTTTPGFTLVNRQFSDLLLTSPVVLVDANTGYVYLVWMDWRYQVIQMARSTDMGNTFTPAVTLWPSGHLNNGGETITNANGTVSIRAASVVMAQYNQASNSIGVVWHQREAGSTRTDVYFCSFSLASQAWGQVRHIGHTPVNDGHDQWNPALDPASDGTFLVTWYDKRDDVNDNNTYRVYATRVYGDGTPYDTNDTVIDGQAAPADPTALPAIQGVRYMGEYQGVWEWMGSWNGTTTYINNSHQDIYTPRVTP